MDEENLILTSYYDDSSDEYQYSYVFDKDDLKITTYDDGTDNDCSDNGNCYNREDVESKWRFLLATNLNSQYGERSTMQIDTVRFFDGALNRYGSASEYYYTMALFNVNGAIHWEQRYLVETPYEIRALYQTGARKLFLVPYMNAAGRIVIFNYEKDFYRFSLVGSFDITNSTYLWSQAFKLSVQEELYFMTPNKLGTKTYYLDKLLVSEDYT